jgi:hypothetical protein
MTGVVLREGFTLRSAPSNNNLCSPVTSSLSGKKVSLELYSNFPFKFHIHTSTQTVHIHFYMITTKKKSKSKSLVLTKHKAMKPYGMEEKFSAFNLGSER